MNKLLFLLFAFSASFTFCQSPTMLEKQLSTHLGQISVQIREVPGTLPLLFLHGVYFDHHLWDQQVAQITDRTVITLDMPLHGNSKAIIEDWDLEDCGQMLLEVLDALGIDQAYAVGHSWGSMTILRAAHRAPERFAAIGLCNMPFHSASPGTKRKFRLGHLFLRFRNFYARQAAKALYGEVNRREQPALLAYLQASMGLLSRKEIKLTNRRVVLEAPDASSLIADLQVPALGLKGEEDYVPVSPDLPTEWVPGGHVSPLEAPEAVTAFVRRLLQQPPTL